MEWSHQGEPSMPSHCYLLHPTNKKFSKFAKGKGLIPFMESPDEDEIFKEKPSSNYQET
jgi:hypothetical protein